MMKVNLQEHPVTQIVQNLLKVKILKKLNIDGIETFFIYDS